MSLSIYHYICQRCVDMSSYMSTFMSTFHLSTGFPMCLCICQHVYQYVIISVNVCVNVSSYLITCVPLYLSIGMSLCHGIYQHVSKFHHICQHACQCVTISVNRCLAPSSVRPHVGASWEHSQWPGTVQGQCHASMITHELFCHHMATTSSRWTRKF